MVAIRARRVNLGFVNRGTKQMVARHNDVHFEPRGLVLPIYFLIVLTLIGWGVYHLFG